MRTKILLATAAVIALSPTLAFAQASTAGGAVGGAIVGGAVGGPVGAAIGAGVGGTIGAAAEPPREVYTYVERENAPSVTVRERVVVGEPLGETVVLRPIPNHTEWRFAVVNNKRVIVDPDNPNAVLWNPATASFDEAWQRLGVDDGMLAVVGGTGVFALFLTLGYDAFFLTRAAASVPRGRPVFPGIGNGVTPEEVFKRYGMVLRNTRLLDPLTPVEEWGPGS